MSSRWGPAMLADRLSVVQYGEIWTPPAAGIPTGSFVARFLIDQGTMTIDSTNAVRRSGQNVRLIPAPNDPTEGTPVRLVVPNVPADALFPDGNELVLYKGCQYDDGTTEVARCGRLLMEDVEIYNQGTTGLYVTLNGRDRGGAISRNKLTVPYSTDGVSSFYAQLTALLDFAYPNLVYNVAPTTQIPAAMHFNINDDPWAAAMQVAASIGYELFPDVDGIIVARPIVDASTLPVSFSYDSGLLNIVTSVQRSLNITNVPNVIVVVAQGSNVGAPLISYWWDSNPASFTFYNATVPVPGSNMATLPAKAATSTYPQTTANGTNAAATSQLQNDLIAQSMGLAAKGTYETIDLQIRDNPAQDVEDVVESLIAGVASSSKRYQLDSIQIQFTHATPQDMKGKLVVA